MLFLIIVHPYDERCDVNSDRDKEKREIKRSFNFLKLNFF